MNIHLTSEQSEEVKQFWNKRNPDEFSWSCSLCKHNTAGDGYLIANIGAIGALAGSIWVMKLCKACGAAVEMATLARIK